MIIETTCGQLYRVTETSDASLAHVWQGLAVKRCAGGFTPKKSTRQELVRKAGSRVVSLFASE